MQETCVWSLSWEDPLEKGMAAAAAAAKSLQSCPTLCNPIDRSPPGWADESPGILQARTLKWVAISFSNAWKWKVKVKSLSRIWLCEHTDCSLPGSSVHGIFQARVLEWGAIAFSKGIALTPVFLSGEFHGQRSQGGYCPWNHKELDITEQLIHTHTYTHGHFLSTYFVVMFLLILNLLC